MLGVFNEPAGKGKQMLPGGSKDKSAKQDGYFAEKYGRVMEGEAYSDPVKLRRRHRMAEAKKNISKAFLPTNGKKAMYAIVFESTAMLLITLIIIISVLKDILS